MEKLIKEYKEKVKSFDEWLEVLYKERTKMRNENASEDKKLDLATDIKIKEAQRQAYLQASIDIENAFLESEANV